MTEEVEKPVEETGRKERVLVAGGALKEDETCLAKVIDLLAAGLSEDAGDDIALSCDAGIQIPAARRERRPEDEHGPTGDVVGPAACGGPPTMTPEE